MPKFGDSQAKPGDDCPDFVVPLAVQLLEARWIAAWPSAVVVWVRALRQQGAGRAHERICLGGRVVRVAGEGDVGASVRD
jgi:hypothetical protein